MDRAEEREDDGEPNIAVRFDRGKWFIDEASASFIPGVEFLGLVIRAPKHAGPVVDLIAELLERVLAWSDGAANDLDETLQLQAKLADVVALLGEAATRVAAKESQEVARDGKLN